jgi:hypothetical protein
MALPMGDYRDPAIVVQGRESQTCKGCRFFVQQRVFDVTYMACKQDKTKHWIDDWKSKRCPKYDNGSGK